MIRPVAATGIAAIDELLGGGLPVGAISEIVGPECSGRTTLALAFLAGMTRQGKVCAWVDVSDTLHPASAAAAGVNLDRLLWVRCGSNMVRPAESSEKHPHPVEAPATARVHFGGNSPHPRSESKGLPAAITDLLSIPKKYKRDRITGTPGAPNRPLTTASSVKPDVNLRKEQVATDRLPARRGAYVLEQREAYEPRCAEPQRRPRPQTKQVQPIALPSLQSSKSAATALKPWSRLDQGLRVTDLLLQAGGFSAIVLDMGSIAPEFASRVPLATWFRYRAAAERTQSSFVMLTQHPCAKSSAGTVLQLDSALPVESEATVFAGLANHVELARRRFDREESNVVPIRKPPQREGGVEWPQPDPMGRQAMSGELYLCLYAREFPAQAMLRLRPELSKKPVAVMEGEAPFQQVCSLNRHARKLGVTAAMSRADMDSFPSVILLKRSASEEQASRLALLESAGSFSPRIEDNSGSNAFSCVLDIAGTEKLFGPPQLLAMCVLQAANALGVSVSIAVSSNFHTAVCLARGSATNPSSIVVPSGAERQALAALPLSVLDVSIEHAETFAQWGVTTLGMLAMLPEKDLIARLGQEGYRLRQLARGESSHLFMPVDTVVVLEERIELDTPVEVLDSLLFGVSLMLDQLIARATARILSVSVVTAELGLDGGTVHTRMVRPALPTNDKQLWLKLLHLDWVAHPPPAAVVSMMLRAETGIVGKIQLGLFSPQLPEPGRLDVTMARIRAVVGEERAGSIELKDSHKPDAFRMKPFSVTSSPPEKLSEPKLPAAVLRCLRPAEKIAMTLRERRPHIFYFRGIAYETEKSYGPWQAAGGWWSEGRWSLEEWDIVARARDQRLTGQHGGQLMCCMVRDVIGNCWQVQALYD